MIFSSLYGGQIRKYIEEQYAIKSEYWMSTEYDERVKNYRKLSNGKFFVKMVVDEGLEDGVRKLNRKPFPIRAFILSISKRAMNNFFSDYYWFLFKRFILGR